MSNRSCLRRRSIVDSSPRRRSFVALLRCARVGVVALACLALPARAEESTEEPLWSPTDCSAILLQVRDGATDKPIPGALVQVEPRFRTPAKAAKAKRPPALRRVGRTTGDGTLVIPPPGVARIVVLRSGFAPESIETPCSAAITVLEVRLREMSPHLAAEASAGGDTHRRVDGVALETVAGSPRNVFQAIEGLPGLGRRTLEGALWSSIVGSGDLGIRGARPGESRAYLDGIDIPYFYHYAALSAILPAEMIEFIDVVPGGAGPQYGRLTGGVLDIRSRAMRGEEAIPWNGRANLTLFETNAIARGPAGGGILSVSDRASIWDLVARSNREAWGELPIWGYNDFQVVYKRPTERGSELQALVFGTFDDLALPGRPTSLHTEFYRAGLTWRTRRGTSTGSLGVSYGYDRFRMRIVEPGQGYRAASHRAQHDLRVAADGEVRFRRVPVRAGVELHAVRPEAGLSLDWEQQEWFLVDRDYWDRGAWAGVWTELELRPLPRLVLLPGLRADADTFVGRGWLDPRGTARYFATDRTSISASGGLYHRPQPFALAFVDDDRLGLTRGTQVSAGVEHRIRSEVQLDARAFWNTFEDQVQGIEWFPDLEGSVVGDGRSRGIELLSRFSTKSGRTRGEIAYTFSRTDWRNLGTEGRWTRSDRDSTHAVTLVASREMRRGWSGGTRIRWYTGLPYTPFGADVYVPDAGGYVGVGDSPWGRRAPSFFQADVRLAKHWSFRTGAGLDAFVDVQNVTNRKNVDRLSTATGGRPTDPGVSPAMPLFPSIGVGLTF